MTAIVRGRPPALESLERLRSLVLGVAVPGGDLQTSIDPRRALPKLLALLLTFAVPVILATAGTELGASYGYPELLALCGGMVVISVIGMFVPWHRVDEQWLLAPIGLHVVFVASLATMTGGSESPYFALYAPLLALAGWHLRMELVTAAVVLVAGTELWRAAVLDGVTAVPQVTVALPFFAALAFGSLHTSRRLLGAVAAIRNDQVRGAATLSAVRDIGRGPEGDAIVDLARICRRVFDAHVSIVRMPVAPMERFRYPVVTAGEGQAQVNVVGADILYAVLTLRREQPFGATELRLVGLLAEVAGRVLDSARVVERIRDEADLDPLTGLRNRGAFSRDLDAALADLGQGGPSVGLVLLDIDDFRALNERMGHAWGSSLLRTASEWLTGRIRARDIAYRLGSDEFAVLARGVTDETVRALGERLRRIADRPARRADDDRRPDMTFSLGTTVAITPIPASTLIRAADVARSAATAAGGDRVVMTTAGEGRSTEG